MLEQHAHINGGWIIYYVQFAHPVATPFATIEVLIFTLTVKKKVYVG